MRHLVKKYSRLSHTTRGFRTTLFVRRFAFGSDVQASRRRPRGAGDAGLHATGDARNDAVFLLSSPSSISSSHSRDEGLLPAAFVPSTSSSSSGAHVDARESTESRLAIRLLAANTSPGRRAASVSPSRSRCSPRSRADTGKLDPNVSTWSSKDRPARSGGRPHASSSSAELGAGLKGGVNGNEGEVVGWVARSGKEGVLAVMHVPKVSMCPSRRRATSSGSGRRVPNRRGDERDPIGLAVRRRRARERVAAAYARMILRVVLHGAGGHLGARFERSDRRVARGSVSGRGRGRERKSNATSRTGRPTRHLGVFDAISSRRSASGARCLGAPSDAACDEGSRRGRRCRERRDARRIPSGTGVEARLAPESRSASRRSTSADTRGRRFFFDARDSRGERNLLRAAAADVSRTSAAALAWVERALRETVAGMVSATRDDDGRRTRRACARTRMMRYVARLRREGRKIRREVRRCRGTRVAGRGALCRRARGIAERLCPPKQ